MLVLINFVTKILYFRDDAVNHCGYFLIQWKTFEVAGLHLEQFVVRLYLTASQSQSTKKPLQKGPTYE
jgi:hypothetical protein